MMKVCNESHFSQMYLIGINQGISLAIATTLQFDFISITYSVSY